MSEMSEMSIDFGAITGAPAPSAGSAETTVATQVDKALANGGEPGSMSCLAMLTPAQQEQARAMAVQQLPAMLADTDKLATFGDPALTAVNAQVNRIFNEVGPVQIPELTTIMHEINDRMRAFRHHYDPADPRVRETFDRFMDAVRGVFQKGRDMVEMLFEEARSVEQQLDRIAGQLSAKQRELKRNVVLCDELYKSNEASISQLVGVIAVMEAILEQAQMKADGIVVDPNAANAHELTEQRARLTDFSMALQTRINEFQQRLFVAWSTSPQIRNIRSLHYGLGQRLALLVNLTIPTMKLTIAQWGLLMQAQQAAGLQQAVADGANEVLSAYASASGRAVPEIARQMQTPTLRPETIIDVAASLDAQATGIEEAVKYGEVAREQVVGAIVVAQRSMALSSQRLGDTVSQLVTASRQKVELPPAPSLPQEVLAQAPTMAQPVQQA